MLHELNEQLIQVKGDIRRKKKLNRQLEDYQNEKAELLIVIDKLRKQLKEEKADVEKLEGISIHNFFSTITGTKYEKLDKENQEVITVQLQLEEANKTLDDIHTSIQEVKNKISAVINSEVEYQGLIEKKELRIKQGDSNLADELIKLTDEEGNMQAYVNELREAMSAGEQALDALDKAIDSLEGARNWGTLDMFGGGMLSGAMKHSKLDKASDHIHIAQSKMRAFQKELLDIDQMIHIDIDVSDLLKFADFFFDGIITDWMVQGRIEDSLDQADLQHYKVEKIVSNLSSVLADSEIKLSDIRKARQKLIEQY
ncbi:hypothetical protein [Ornithinibacillus xuwenensis]|uniref:Uncharacterized protein n=1 Tax=Ornithinibacillus xuwenensis TaxID=3144668 RepID=A0ABU9XJE8_9BACI